MLWNLAKYLTVKRQTDRTKQYDSKEKCIKLLHKVGTFAQDFKDWRKIKRTAYQNLEDLQNLLIKLTVKARAEKAWLLYEFPFSLNPSEKPNDAQKLKSYSSLYSVIIVQGKQNKTHQILAL